MTVSLFVTPHEKVCYPLALPGKRNRLCTQRNGASFWQRCLVIPYHAVRHSHQLKRISSCVGSETTSLYATQCDTIRISDDRLQTRNRFDNCHVKERCLALLPVFGIGQTRAYSNKPQRYDTPPESHLLPLPPPLFPPHIFPPPNETEHALVSAQTLSPTQLL